MLEGTGHTVDFAIPRADRLGRISPGNGNGCDLFDEDACLSQRQRKIFR